MRLDRLVHFVDCHAAGEVGNVIVGGVADPPGTTMLAKRDHVVNHEDWLRTTLLFEPRGSVAHHANLLVAPTLPEADMGYIVIEPTEYPVMSGSNTMCVATVLLETGIVPMTEPVTVLNLESPAGLIRVECDCADGKVTRVSLLNQPAFAYHLDATVEVPGFDAPLVVDVAWGGMTYVLVDAAALGLTMVPDEARLMCELGERIKRAAADQLPVEHPTQPGMTAISQTLFCGPLATTERGLESTNGVVISPGRLDRSPCGTGSSARLAVLHAKGILGEGETLWHHSVVGSTFEATIDSLTTVGDYPALRPKIAGQAWITGTRQVGVHPTDPFAAGHTVGDVWFDMSGEHLRRSSS